MREWIHTGFWPGLISRINIIIICLFFICLFFILIQFLFSFLFIGNCLKHSALSVIIELRNEYYMLLIIKTALESLQAWVTFGHCSARAIKHKRPFLQSGFFLILLLSLFLEREPSWSQRPEKSSCIETRQRNEFFLKNICHLKNFHVNAIILTRYA